MYLGSLQVPATQQSLEQALQKPFQLFSRPEPPRRGHTSAGRAHRNARHLRIRANIDITRPGTKLADRLRARRRRGLFVLQVRRWRVDRTLLAAGATKAS